MPIYEFYCPDCHALYSFFAGSPRARRKPECPDCGRPGLERRPSTFAMIRPGDGESEDEDDPFAGIDEERLEGAMDGLAHEVEQMGDSEDPRALGRFFRRFGEMTGLELGPKMEDVIRRMEAGEDPDALEDEMGGAEEDSLDELFRLKRSMMRRARRPRVDPTLHFL
ncbi:MAG TPA: FmdB family zinc ribbon protein [Thermoanaerobaculia bacterium]|nr:FmdB family zinc ribbon protein [Thermoanaerobaculia bacterium]